MNHEMIILVQKSLKDVAPLADAVGATFYRRLFEIAPELRPLFADDIRPQERKLMKMLAMVANGLHRLPALLPQVEELGRRHADYGVVESHYPVVGEALIWTLEHHLGEAFTPRIRMAWIAAYKTLAQTMVAAVGEPACDREWGARV